MLKNASTGGIIADNYRLCRSPASKALGLMLRSRVKRPLVFVFSKSKRRSLHMWFVFCSIDLLFLDEMHQVVEIRERFRPFTHYRSTQPACTVIELSAGTVSSKDIRHGHRIAFSG